MRTCRKISTCFIIITIVSALLYSCSSGKKETLPTLGAPVEMEEMSLMPRSKAMKKVSGSKRVKGPSGLKAGFADDNKQFNYYLNFIKKYSKDVPHRPLNVDERIIISVADKKGLSVPNAGVEIYDGEKLVSSGITYADGSFLFFPSMLESMQKTYSLKVSSAGNSKLLKLNREGSRNISVTFETDRPKIDRVPLDIVFFLDTTGSMGEEIERLKRTIEIIELNLSQLSTKPYLRFGMVLYKDREDSYVTKSIPLTSDMKSFRASLNKVSASGGGDIQEDLESALYEGVSGLKWNKEGIRLGFIITDAPPHIDYEESDPYTETAIKAKENAIKIFSVGTGGLNIVGEYVLRQIAQVTSGKYIFLTYGEKGESEGGKAGSVSHHTGDNFNSEKLEAIIIRFAKDELNHLSEKPVEKGDEFFQATKIDSETKEETLKTLFDRAVSQLIDYSSVSLIEKPAIAVIPLTAKEKVSEKNKAESEYLTEHLLFAVSRSKKFKLVERDDLQAVNDEIKTGLSGSVDEKSASEIGKFIGASVLITGKMYINENSSELFLKLVKVETAEVLSLTKVMIDRSLLF